MGRILLGEFGDLRRDEVGAELLAACVKKRTVSVRRLAGGRAQEMRYARFLHNEEVTTQAMLKEAARRTREQSKGRHILVIHDTTESNFAHHAGRKLYCGEVGNGKDIGFFCTVDWRRTRQAGAWLALWTLLCTTGRAWL